MAVNAVQTARLTALADSIDCPDVNLAGMLQALIDDLERTITSYLGLSLNLLIDTQPVTVTVMEDSVDSHVGGASAATLPLALLNGAAGSSMTLYAANPGAFVDLGADVSLLMGAELSHITLAEDAPLPIDDPTFSALAEFSHVNQAIGVLVGRGHSQAGADSELHRLAHIDATTIDAIAQQLITSTTSAPRGRGVKPTTTRVSRR